MPRSIANPGSRADRWLIIALLALMGGLPPMCMDMYLPSLPLLAEDLAVTASMAQGSITACLLGLAIGQVVIGPISDGTGRLPMLTGTLAVFTATSLACAFTDSGVLFLGLRFLQGLAGAGGVVLCRAICCDSFRGVELTGFLAGLMAVQSLAPILSPIIGGAVADKAGWHAIFLLIAAVGAAIIAGSRLRLPETLPPEKHVQGGVGRALANLPRLLRERDFMPYVGIQAFSSAAFFAYLAASPFVFQGIYHLTTWQFGLIFTANAVGVSCVSLLTRNLSRRFGNARPMLAGCALRALFAAVVLAACVLLPASPLPMIAALFCMAIMQGLIMPTSFALGISSQAVGAGAASGMFGLAHHLFGALASPVVGVLGPQNALPMGVTCAVSTLVCLALCLATYRHALRQDELERAATGQD